MSHGHPHVLRSVAEGVAFAMRILLHGYQTSVAPLNASPIVTGGATRSREWMRLLADVLGADLQVSVEPDAACVGAAILAAIAVGDASDSRSGAERMACSTATVATDGATSRAYDRLFAAYERDARAISELYAARTQTPEGSSGASED